MCEEKNEKRLNMCCEKELGWKSQEASFVGTQGQRYKLWWPGNDKYSEEIAVWS